MNSFLQFLDGLASQQDFFWFLGILAWLGVLMVIWQERGGETRVPAWLGVSAMAAIAQAAVALTLTILPRAINVGVPQLAYDWALWWPLALFVGALAWGASGGWARAGLVAGVALVTVAHVRWPEISAHALALLAAVSCRRLLHTDKSDGTWRSGIALLVALPLASPVGPVALWVHEAQMWRNLSRLALPCALTTIAAGAVWLKICLARAQAAHPTADVAERKRFALGLGSWLVVGFALTQLSGRIARVNYEQALLAQARLCVALLDPAQVAELVSPALRLSAPIETTMPDGRRGLYYATTTWLSAERVGPVRAALSRGRDATGALYVHLETLRERWLVSFLFDDGIYRQHGFGLVPFQREIAADDRVAWAERRESIRFEFLWGEHVRARAPVRAPDGRMLGWLALEMPMNRWLAAQAQVRLEALLLTGSGVVLGLLLFGLRARAREKSAAEQLAIAAQSAERMQTIFLAKVSHELRTPVQNILGYAQLLRPPPNDGAAREHIEAVLAQGRLMIRLVNDLIDLSAAQSGSFRLRLKPCRVEAVIKEAVEAMRPRAVAKGLALEVELTTSGLGPVACDTDRLRQVTTNLVGNAIKFTAAGWVRVTFAPTDETGRTFQLTVSDSGPGIAVQDQMNLFRPFERLRVGGETEGSGLGLALTRMICVAMGGSLEVSSDGRTGTTFVAKFTVPPMTEPAITPLLVSPGGGRALSCRVLVAEDNHLVRRLFRVWLEQAGATVTEAGDGEEAHRQIQTDCPDVLLLDLSMPRLDGITLTQRLRSEGHGPDALRIVGVSAHAGAAERMTALNAGMDAFLLKPIEAAELLATIGGLHVPITALAAASDSMIELIQSLRRAFSLEAPGLLQALTVAVGARDFLSIAKLAHELGNAAFAIQDRALGESCASLERAAHARDPAVEERAARVAAAVQAALELSFASVTPTAQSKP